MRSAVTQTRREFLKTVTATGAVLVVSGIDVLGGPQARAAPNAPPAGWKGRPGRARYRIDGLAKVTGQKLYARDFRARDMVGWPPQEQHVFVLRAGFADRIFEGVDLGFLPEALRPVRVVTAADLARDGIGIAGTDFPEGMYLVAPGTRPDHLGQPVALLFYDDRRALERARPLLLYGGKAITEGAGAAVPPPTFYEPETSILHYVKDGPEPYAERVTFAQTLGGPVHPEEPGTRNADAMEYVRRIGERIDAADWIVHRQRYDTQVIDPMFMEPESGLAWLDRESQTLHLLIGSQSPQYDARSASELFAPEGCKIAVKTVDFTACYLGGGFGGRDTSILCLYLALAAAYAEGPIRILYDRYEQFQAGVKRHATRMDLTLALDGKGRFQALRNHTLLNGGGRINVSAYVAQVAGIMAAGVYDFPMADVWSRSQHTRSIVAGSMRGFGAAQTTFAIESMVDEAAESLGIDPIDLRRKNVLRPGWSIVTGAPKAPPGLAELCDRARAHPLWRSRGKLREAGAGQARVGGVGFAVAMKNYGTGADAVLSDVAVDEAGRIVVTSHAVEMGTGTTTALAISTAAALGANADEVKTGEIRLFEALRMVESFEEQPANPRWTPILYMSHKAATTSSRWVHGVEQSSRVLFETGLLPAARALWGGRARRLGSGDVRWKDSRLVAAGFRALTLPEIAARAHADGHVVAVMNHAFFSARWTEAAYTVDGVSRRLPVDGLAIRRAGKDGYEIIDREDPKLFTVESMWEGNGQTFGASACLVRVEVDRATGSVRVVEGVHFLAPGHVLQPDLVEGQMDGSFAMGVGFALLEDLPPFEDGASDGRWNLDRYHVALAGDCALHRVEKVILPPESPEAPARGIAEVAFCPVAPAIANAVAHATGVRFRELPITRDKVRAAAGAEGNGG